MQKIELLFTRVKKQRSCLHWLLLCFCNELEQQKRHSIRCSKVNYICSTFWSSLLFSLLVLIATNDAKSYVSTDVYKQIFFLILLVEKYVNSMKQERFEII